MKKKITLVGEWHSDNNGALEWIKHQDANICCEIEPRMIADYTLMLKDKSIEELLTTFAGIPSSVLPLQFMQLTQSKDKKLYGVDCGPSCTSYVQDIVSYVNQEENIAKGQIHSK